jgi:hypothetical protein
MDAARISPISFLFGEIGKISSFAPIKKMIIKEQSIYCKSPNRPNGVQRIIEKITPAKMAMPPREGVLSV